MSKFVDIECNSGVAHQVILGSSKVEAMRKVLVTASSGRVCSESYIDLFGFLAQENLTN